MTTQIDIDDNDEQVFHISKDPEIQVVAHNDNAFIMTEEGMFSLYSKNQFLTDNPEGNCYYTEGEDTIYLSIDQIEMVNALFDQGLVKEKEATT